MSYLEILATIYVFVNTVFIISALKRDKIFIDNKAARDSYRQSVCQYQDKIAELLTELSRKQIELSKLKKEKEQAQ
jgi:hypothetical protein